MRIGGRALPLALGLLGALSGQSTSGSALEGGAPAGMLADFDHAGWRTNLGDPFGAWNSDPGDPTQFCHARLVEEPRVGAFGYSLMLQYDVDSPNPAYNGFWMKLPSVAIHPAQVLSLAVKGDPAGFTRRMKLELKSGQRSATYVLDGIQEEWVRMRVPLSAFQNIERVHRATEFVIVFDEDTVTEKTGTVYVDEVALKPGA